MADPAPDSDLADRVRLDFLCRFHADQAAGSPRPLVEYLRGQDAFAAVIEAEWQRLQEALLVAPATEPAAVAGSAEAPLGVPPHYHILRELGRGGQGVVYLARDTRLQRDIALKILPHSGAIGSARSLRFQREVLATGRLDHASLCAVHDAGTTPDTAWLAMKFVDGPSLQQQLAAAAASGRAPRTAAEFAAVAALVERLADGLQHAHERGLVHRDIKPGNVLVGRDGVPVLVDFGLVRGSADTPEAVTVPGAVPGTPSYMAPELLRGAPATAASDLWSLGAVLFELLALRRPFVAPTVAAELRQRATDGMPDVRTCNRAVPKDLAAIVATALAEVPEQRYRSAGELAADLRRFRESRPVAARVATPWQVLHRWMRRNPALATSLAALGLFLVAGFAVALHLLGDTRAALADVLRLSDQRRANDLLGRAEQLWPLRAERLGGALGFDAWLRDAGELLARRHLHEQAAARLALAEADDATVAWQREQVGTLLQGLEQLELVHGQVLQRRAFAATVAQRTLQDQAPAWTATAAAIRQSPLYRGLELAPQLGLVPLGPDPESGMFEFAHLQSGAVPARDATGRLVLDADSAIVLVLVPGGRYRIGSAASPPPDGSPAHLDPATEPGDGPCHEVALAPFLLGKFEVTQAQWLRHTSRNPSNYTAQSECVGPPVTPLHPVEQVPWTDAERVLRELDLVVPTEAQWEAAYRAGTTTPYPYGDTVASLQGHENLADQSARELSVEAKWPFVLALRDGHPLHAPVGTFAANSWGFHDLGGNVREWCADSWENYADAPPRAGDGRRFGAYDKYRIVRGGCFSSDGSPARSASRTGLPVTTNSAVLGVRAARPVLP
jgi:formylglycine-generating enzyme required for sulfatase activity